MTVNQGGPRGSNVLATHPSRKKLGRVDGKRARLSLKPSKDEQEAPPQPVRRKRPRFCYLQHLPERLRDRFLDNILSEHADRIEQITPQDLSTAFQSLPGFSKVPLSTDHKGKPAISVNLKSLKFPVLITVESVVAQFAS